MLQAARELFEDRGYEYVSTRDVATRAGVTQATVFRHFGTKIDLFVEAVYQPFSNFVTDYLARWGKSRVDDGLRSVRDTEEFVGGLFRLLVDNRRLLATLSSVAAADDSDLSHRATPLLADLLDRIEIEVVRTVAARGVPTMDPAYSVRFTFALVYGAAMLSDALFPAGSDETARTAITETMAGFVLRGATLGAAPTTGIG